MTGTVPGDSSITIDQLTLDPYPIYKKLRAQSPVLRVESVGRTFLTCAAETRYVKDHPEIFSSNDPNTPMKRAFNAHTLMRKDGPEHRQERMSMAATLAPKTVEETWAPLYQQYAEDYVSRLPVGETVDLFKVLCGPIAARILADMMGMPQASDEDIQRWSQVLINAAGNFGWLDQPFIESDKANAEMDACIQSHVQHLQAEPDMSALSLMINAKKPIAMSQVLANIKIAIGGGINEPRHALATVVYGLLTNPDQLEAVKKDNTWKQAFEEAIRWVAPIQVSSRLVMHDTEVRGFHIPAGDTVMTVQASANHDEDLFDSPEKFIVNRASNPHQAFGNGPHHCAGTHTARAQVAQIMLPLLFDRFPDMTLPNPAQVLWRGFGFRGPINLPVKLG